METIRKNITKLALLTLLLGTLGFTACGEGPTEKTGNTSTEDMVEGTDGGLDSLDLPADTTKNQ